MRFLIKFSYDGTAYNGFQTQPGLITIQENLEKALQIINNGKKTPIVATGRTDKGVHALCQYGHADIDVNITEKKLKKAMNSNLPDDIHVIETTIVDDDFHARYNVKSKELLSSIYSYERTDLYPKIQLSSLLYIGIKNQTLLEYIIDNISITFSSSNKYFLIEDKISTQSSLETIKLAVTVGSFSKDTFLLNHSLLILLVTLVKILLYI